MLVGVARGLPVLALVLGVAAWVAGAEEPAPAAARQMDCAARWRVVARAGVPALTDVSAVSARAMWAVGSVAGPTAADPGRPVVVHWDGSRLRTRPLAWQGANLRAVSAATRRDVWAVGELADGPFVARWNGRRWLRAALPPVKGSLSDVAAITPTEAWAVGTGGAAGRPLVLRWNGRRWRIVDLRKVAPRASDLRAIDASSSTDVWAVGATNLDAASSYGYSDLVLRWNGRAWKRVDSGLARLGTGPIARAVAVAPSRDVWTVNSDLSGNEPYFVRWDGRTRRVAGVSRWSLGDRLHHVADVAALGSADAWAVGAIDWDAQGRPLESPLIGRWDAKSWRVHETAFDGVRNASLTAISAISPTDVWAVGDRLVLRYSC